MNEAEEQVFAVQRDPRLRILIPLIVAVAFLMEQIDMTIITTAIPDMARSLATTPLRLNLAVTAYVLTLAVFIPPSGWFADRFGSRRVFVVALGVFTIGSAFCGLAQSFGMLLAMRVLQGIGGAMMTPVARLILLRSFPRSEFITAMTYMTLPVIVGPVVGPLLGGFITTYASWRWIFYVNLPVGVAGILLTLRFIGETRGETRTRFDFPGFVMFGGGMVLLQLAMDAIGRPDLSTAALAGLPLAAVALLVGFFVYARRVAAPVIDLGLFRLRSFAVGTLAGGIVRVGLNGMPFLLPLMLQVGFGMSAMQSGSLTFLATVGSFFIRVVTGPFLRWFGFDKVLIGSAVLGAVMLAGFALLQPDTPRWLIGLQIFVFGLVRSTQFMTSNTLAYADTPGARLSHATSLGGVIQQLTVSFGVSLSAMLLGLISRTGGALTPERFHAVFLMMALLPLAAVPGFLRLRPEDGAMVSGYRRRK